MSEPPSKDEMPLSARRLALQEHIAAVERAAEPASDLLKMEARLATAIQAEGAAQAALAAVNAANGEKMRAWADGDSVDAPELDEEGAAKCAAAVAKASVMALAARDAMQRIQAERSAHDQAVKGMKAQREPLIAGVLLEEAEAMLSRLEQLDTERHQINISLMELRSLFNSWPFLGNEQGQYAAMVQRPTEVIHPGEYPNWAGFRNALAFDATATIRMVTAFDQKFTGVQNNE